MLRRRIRMLVLVPSAGPEPVAPRRSAAALRVRTDRDALKAVLKASLDGDLIYAAEEAGVVALALARPADEALGLAIATLRPDSQG